MIQRLSPEQIDAARQVAAAVRSRRAQFKQRLRCGDISWAEALDLAVVDPVLCRIKIIDLLMAVPGVGRKTADAILQRKRIMSDRRCSCLGRNQIAGLKAELD
jgi:3-methyladenine DNA glycosylase/8-oxoguanine DNA glycosylase